MRRKRLSNSPTAKLLPAMATTSLPVSRNLKPQPPHTSEVFCGTAIQSLNLPERPGDVFDEPVLKELLDLFAHEQGVLRQAALKALVKGW